MRELGTHIEDTTNTLGSDSERPEHLEQIVQNCGKIVNMTLTDGNYYRLRGHQTERYF